MDITTIAQFDQHFTDRLLGTVADQRLNWIDWKHFFTLGTTTYMEDPWSYMAHANLERPRMEEAFGWAYKALGMALEAHFGKPVAQHPNAACPGFHIFFKTDVAPQIHYDIPFQKVFWPEPFDSVFTFTLPILLPSAGGGLDIWNNHTPDTARHAEPDQHVEYEVGELYVHNGLTTHGISIKYPMGEGEYRVTLQGHGARLALSDVLVVFF